MHKTLLNRFLNSSSDNRKSKTCTELRRSIQKRPRRRKLVGSVALVVTLAMCGAVAMAQQPKKVPRIGYLSVSSPSAMSTRTEAFRQGLHELGYVDGKNIVVEWRFADGKLERLPEFVAELAHLEVDVIVTGGPQATHPAKQASTTIPIVMSQDNDPVGNGFVTSLAWPGGNVTGLSNLSSELAGKRLELLKEIVPKLSRVAVSLVMTRDQRRDAALRKEIEVVAQALALQVQFLQIRDAKDIETAFRSAKEQRADALLSEASLIFSSQQTKVIELAIKNRLPVMYARQEFVDAGGLLSYAASITDMDRRAATFVDKILKGAKPADLPVEQPKKFEFIINLKAAKQIGLTIPPNVLVRADRVIK